MEFGDEVLLAAWNKGEPYVFAQFTINQVLLQNDTAVYATDWLVTAGLAERIEGDPIHVAKECGEFTISGGCVVSCEMGEIVAAAIDIAPTCKEDAWFMIGGSITALYNNFGIDPRKYKKIQGFTQIGTGEENEGFDAVPRVLLEVRGYTN